MDYMTDTENTMSHRLLFSPCLLRDINSDEILSIMTPKVRRESSNLSSVTPKVKKDLFALFQDEDSGLGMEDGEVTATRDELSPLDFTGRLYLSDNSIQTNSAFRRPLFSGKRRREETDDDFTPSRKQQRKLKVPIRRTLSLGDSPVPCQLKTTETNSNDVMSAVNRLVEEDLIGDGSRSHCLPTVSGKHQDLKSITPQTMADVLHGDFDDVINSYRVIDCRYPYEYNGGHIQGAENIYTHDSVQELLVGNTATNGTGKRNILILHCEFSSERGPKMSRFLRKQDRAMNQQNYPSLCYPEVYLLDGGYKAFYHGNQDLCFPMEYKPMLHQDHASDLRHFRTKSKTWTAGEKKRRARSLRL